MKRSIHIQRIHKALIDQCLKHYALVLRNNKNQELCDEINHDSKVKEAYLQAWFWLVFCGGAFLLGQGDISGHFDRNSRILVELFTGALQWLAN